MITTFRRSPRRFALAVAVAVALVVGVFLLIVFRPAPPIVPIVPNVPIAAAEPPASLPPASPSPSPTPIPSSSPTPIPSPSPTTVISGVADLTGLKVDDALAHRLPIAVLIDDNRIARPQSGFNGASIVYQAPADGGETRYMFVYQEGESRDIGPVRSGRSYFIHWAEEVRAGIAHYGGDRVTRSHLKWHDGELFTDIDALRTLAKPFHRISTRRAPHNAYTGTAALRAGLKALHAPAVMPPDLARRTFVDESPLAARAAKQTIRIPYQTGVVGYVFDALTNRYRRTLDARTQVDPADGKIVTTTNVVVLYMRFHTDSSIEAGHSRPVLGEVGTGRALVFREGHLVVGTWRKSNATALTRLFNAQGTELPLVRGRTFFQVVPSGTKVTPSR